MTRAPTTPSAIRHQLGAYSPLSIALCQHTPIAPIHWLSPLQALGTCELHHSLLSWDGRPSCLACASSPLCSLSLAIIISSSCRRHRPLSDESSSTEVFHGRNKRRYVTTVWPKWHSRLRNHPLSRFPPPEGDTQTPTEMFISRKWRYFWVMIGLMVAELGGTVATLALFGIASPDAYRTQLWKVGGENGFNSSPDQILYAYANYRPIPKTPLVWSEL